VTTRIGPAEDGQVLTVAPGQLFELVLPENPSTGYQWEVLPSPGITVVDDRFEPGEMGDQVGMPGQRVIDMRADRPGEVMARLRRPWEVSVTPAQTFDLRVTTR